MLFQGRASGWERVNWAYLPILFLKLSSPRPTKTVLFVILLCLTPDDFTRQRRASGWERVNWAYLPILFLNLSSPRLSKTVLFVILLCLTPDNFTHQGKATQRGGKESHNFEFPQTVLSAFYKIRLRNVT